VTIVGAVVGALLVLSVTVSIISTLVIPRGRVGFMKVADRAVDAVYRRVAGLLGTYERRDALLSGEPVVILAVMLMCWLAGYAVGYGLVLWPMDHGLGRALRESGSSLFTLGFAANSGSGSTIVDFVAAASGLIVVALQIAYLPTLYSAYNRRETEVTLLGPRSGIPAWGPEILARVHIARGVDQLPMIYESWERWSADVAESHSSYPSLLRFRSPDPHASWIVSQLAVLDAAALHLSACPETAPFTARLCLQMGFTCLRKLTHTLHLPVDDDPRPDDPIQLSWDDFLEGWQRLLDVGFPVERPADEAWRHFRGWRVNYETSAYLLARGVDAVPSKWSGTRRNAEATITPRRFVNRTPDDPEGRAVTRWRPTGPVHRED
jgi:type IV secretory pathway TrbD component